MNPVFNHQSNQDLLKRARPDRPWRASSSAFRAETAVRHGEDTGPLPHRKGNFVHLHAGAERRYPRSFRPRRASAAPNGGRDPARAGAAAPGPFPWPCRLRPPPMESFPAFRAMPRKERNRFLSFIPAQFLLHAFVYLIWNLAGEGSLQPAGPCAPGAGSPRCGTHTPRAPACGRSCQEKISPSGDFTTRTSSFFGLCSPQPAHIRIGIFFWRIAGHLAPCRFWPPRGAAPCCQLVLTPALSAGRENIFSIYM